ncbi:putative peptidoglycan biosynthesis protein MviN [Corynebacterium capitovis DSM 44611]|uniref:murein biosynthesis integral membrane protein MurJ n=1 Tax=Corynebacterium capitovis TaxID=131081 RepID=UPI00037A861B|nr:murein biosynthesis integral membrane protein MurJ [Corynebacterium capitovis]WKD58428.1 putative peptidoglycan biosynthesis protein MviN [Corynebacterium capitovis DSM 44611]
MTQPESSQRATGLRRRIVTPAPPAPVPTLREKESEADGTGHPDRSALTTSPSGESLAPDAPSEAQAQTNSDVVRSTGSMAIATLISRITGFIRTVLIGAALGGPVASAFNTANTLPNLITEIVLGSVLTALVVPVLVRAEKEDPDRGATFIRRLFTLTLTLMTVVTLAAVAAAPLLTRLMLDEDGRVNIAQSTSFAFLLLPQIFFYGMFSLFMAVLNTKEHFRPGAWAPVANNVVSIAVLLLYMVAPGQLAPAEKTSLSDPHVLILGLGTTLGVVVQCLIMLPALRKLGIDLRPLWGLDDRLKAFGGMALAIIAYVAVSQLGYIATTRIASHADSSAPFIYQQHWMLLQVPYGVIGVTLLTAIMPRLSRDAADGDDQAVVRDLELGTKLTFIALIPLIIFMTAFGPDIGHALFAYGNFDPHHARTLGLTVSFSAFTLIPYALVMLHLRVFYAREEAWTPTFIIAGITATKIVLSYLAPAVAGSPESVVVLLGAANGFGFIAGAIIGAFLLRRKLGTLRAGSVLRTSLWAAGASLAGVAVTFALRFVAHSVLHDPARAFGRLIGLPSSGFLLEVAVLGVVFLIVTGLVLSRSRLPEVQNVGRALSRIPGMGRFIRPDDGKAVEVGEIDPRDMSTQFLAADTFNASPVPPPLSAGVVRGPRLVPGASVSDGRFRLIRDHGATTGARFWQAREVSTGRMVALTFVDTSGVAPLAPATPREAAINAAGVARRTRKLAALNLPSVADNIRVLSYRTGVLVVADWIPGATLKNVAEAGHTLHAEAVANSLAPLASGIGAAHEAGVPFGLDNRNRLRVSTDGVVRLAFPAILPDSSGEEDARALASALTLLTTDVSSRVLEGVTAETRSLADAPTTAPDDFRSIAATLERLSQGEAAQERRDLSDAVEAGRRSPEPDPEALRGGFGRRAYHPAAFFTIIAAAVAAVVAIAALTVYIFSVLGGPETYSPVAPGTARETASSAAAERGRAVMIRPVQVSAYGALNEPGVEAAADGDTATTWGAGAGAGLVLRAGGEFETEQVNIASDTEGASVTLYGITGADGDDELAGATELGSGVLSTGTTSVSSASAAQVRGVMILFADAANVAEVDVIGRTAP